MPTYGAPKCYRFRVWAVLPSMHFDSLKVSLLGPDYFSRRPLNACAHFIARKSSITAFMQSPTHAHMMTHLAVTRLLILVLFAYWIFGEDSGFRSVCSCLIVSILSDMKLPPVIYRVHCSFFGPSLWLVARLLLTETAKETYWQPLCLQDMIWLSWVGKICDICLTFRHGWIVTNPSSFCSIFASFRASVGRCACVPDCWLEDWFYILLFWRFFRTSFDWGDIGDGPISFYNRSCPNFLIPGST